MGTNLGTVASLGRLPPVRVRPIPSFGVRNTSGISPEANLTPKLRVRPGRRRTLHGAPALCMGSNPCRVRTYHVNVVTA
jgi:hypothetical protein